MFFTYPSINSKWMKDVEKGIGKFSFRSGVKYRFPINTIKYENEKNPWKGKTSLENSN